MDKVNQKNCSEGLSVGIMQPYFIPYWGYFAHIHQCDFWVVFDQPKYSRKTWVSRNYIQNTQGKAQLISVPVTFDNPQNKTIQNAIIQKEATQAQWLIKKLNLFSKAPFYKDVIDIINQAYGVFETNKLCNLNTELMVAICKYLKIEFNYIYSSQLDYDINQVKKSGDWAFEISKALNAKTYINPITGFSLFEISKFKNAGIDLQFIKTNGFPFANNGADPIQHYSILDTLFNNSIETVISVQTSNIDILSWQEASNLINSGVVNRQ